MKKIWLNKGKYTLVDNKDYDHLSQWKWCITNGGYARRTISKDGKVVGISMHRLIMDTPDGMETDHINHDKLDNQRQNLRICTKSQNHFNRLKNRVGSSYYRGVSWNKQKKSWETAIKLNKKRIFIGYFKNERYAAMAWDIWAKDLYGKFARLNFC